MSYRGGCPGPIGVTSPALVAVSGRVGLRGGPTWYQRQYCGLLRLVREDEWLSTLPSAAVQGGRESIYIPQHPLGYGKRIAWLYNGQPGRVESLTVTECREDDVGYYIDTQEGASGSPILGTSDHNVIAMHHCGGCLNGGIPAQSIIEDLTTKVFCRNAPSQRRAAAHYRVVHACSRNAVEASAKNIGVRSWQKSRKDCCEIGKLWDKLSFMSTPSFHLV
uniref:Serine protease n=1 Tax=Peronospora matthiolae TaxID=2874970 RepID=A0AAV1U858_9STRA